MGDPKLQGYMDAVVNSLGPGRAEVQTALELIDERNRGQVSAQALQLLALRRYVRIGGKKIEGQWAWTEAQGHRNMKSAETKGLMAEVEKVKKAFAAANPGHSLGVSPLRSLERQIDLWRDNSTVRQAANNLMSKAMKMIDDEDCYPFPLNAASVGRFKVDLRDYPVIPEPSSAAPGTSDHGQMHAVDLVVVSHGRTIANTSTGDIERVWKGQGWEAKLIKATAGTRLVGPLKHPYEPWHWRIGR
jgi:hypothetical protein